MKIGCITWWRNNYGSILQAYALQRTIKKGTNFDYEIVNQYSVKTASISNLIMKLKTVGPYHTIKRLFFRFSLRGLRNRVSNMQLFIDSKLSVSKTVYSYDDLNKLNDTYDIFICGSDQIWNPANVPLTDELYWLNFVSDNKRKIAYAPSIGVTDLGDNEKSIIRKHLLSFSSISCREKSGADFINDTLNDDKCVCVVDPTLLLDASEWEEELSDRVVNEKYVFAYMLRGTKEDRMMIEEYAHSKQLSIVSIPFLDSENPVMYDLKFGDFKIWDASPSDFLSLIKNAECIFTDSFHCTIFSILFHKKFFVLKKLGKLQMERLTGIQSLLGTGNRMVNTSMSINDIDNMDEINWNYVDEKRLACRKESLEYLFSAINLGDSDQQ